MSTLKILTLIVLPIGLALALWFGLGAYIGDEESQCGMSRAAESRLLSILSPAEAVTLESLRSVAEFECPDVFRFQYKRRQFELTSFDVVMMGEPRAP